LRDEAHANGPLRAWLHVAIALRVLHFLIHSTLAYTLPIETVQTPSKYIAIGSAAAVLTAAGLALSM
jgi:hypothetical protein